MGLRIGYGWCSAKTGNDQAIDFFPFFFSKLINYRILKDKRTLRVNLLNALSEVILSLRPNNSTWCSFHSAGLFLPPQIMIEWQRKFLRRDQRSKVFHLIPTYFLSSPDAGVAWLAELKEDFSWINRFNSFWTSMIWSSGKFNSLW